MQIYQAVFKENACFLFWFID